MKYSGFSISVIGLEWVGNSNFVYQVFPGVLGLSCYSDLLYYSFYVSMNWLRLSCPTTLRKLFKFTYNQGSLQKRSTILVVGMLREREEGEMEGMRKGNMVGKRTEGEEKMRNTSSLWLKQNLSVPD